jgi:AraC-like DNA-binding protein
MVADVSCPRMTNRLEVRQIMRAVAGPDAAVAVQRVDRYRNQLHGPAWHTHDVVEMNAIIDGEGEYHFPGHRHRTGPGCLGIVHYGQAHNIRTGPEGMLVINVYLDLERQPLPAIGGDLQPALDRLLPQRPSLRHRRSRFVHFAFPPGRSPVPVLHAMLDEQHARRGGWQEAVSAHLRVLLIAIARAAGEAVTPLPERRGDAALARLAARIEDDPAGDHRLSDLAAAAGMRPSSLCRAFRRFAGLPPEAFVARVRAARAADLIRAGMAVGDAALAVGFADRSTCYRAMRRFAGNR